VGRRLAQKCVQEQAKLSAQLGNIAAKGQGRRSPEGPARIFLTVISHSPKTVKNALEKEARMVTSQPASATVTRAFG
jgi:hypothetical protein